MRMKLKKWKELISRLIKKKSSVSKEIYLKVICDSSIVLGCLNMVKYPKKSQRYNMVHKKTGVILHENISRKKYATLFEEYKK